MTVLQLVKAAAYEANYNVPSALASATDLTTLQQINLLYATGRELRKARWWPQLKRRYTFYLQSGRKDYPLPQDFFASIPETHWDGANTWELRGPLSDAGWNYREYGYVTTENRRSFRIFGLDSNPNSTGGQLQIHPTPADGDAGVAITFEYISKSWLQPPNWTASTSYSSGNYVNCGGSIFTSGSTATSGTVAPMLSFGSARDGGAVLKAITKTAWQADTLYKAGDYVTNGGNLYQCSIGGTSASSGGPSGTSTTAETDNTISWIYRALTTWAGQTDFAEGDHILAGSNYYRVTEAGKSGSTQPTWTTTTMSDGTITWTFKEAAYEAIVTDSDLCVFDDDLMIQGLKWRFLRAKGAGYADVKKEYEQMKDAAVNRWKSGMRFSIAGDENEGVTLPFIPEGSFEF